MIWHRINCDHFMSIVLHDSRYVFVQCFLPNAINHGFTVFNCGYTLNVYLGISIRHKRFFDCNKNLSDALYGHGKKIKLKRFLLSTIGVFIGFCPYGARRETINRPCYRHVAPSGARRKRSNVYVYRHFAPLGQGILHPNRNMHNHILRDFLCPVGATCR